MTHCATTCQTPRWGPHDPMTAVELAALVLIKDKGAPTGKPIDAYGRYAEAYNGSGPAAAAYADRVIADAHAYQGQGTSSVSVAGCAAAPGGYINPFKGEATRKQKRECARSRSRSICAMSSWAT
jgi:hypothetical protein